MDSSYSDYIDSNMVWYRGFDAKKADEEKMYEIMGGARAKLG